MLLGNPAELAETQPMSDRPQRKHILVIDGTQSQLNDGIETNAGLLYKLLQESTAPADTTLWYNPGIQGNQFLNWVTIASGWGINKIIANAYKHLSRNYKPGDKIYLFGFSRGAFAVRSVAGMICQLGLMRQDHVTQRKIAAAFRLYERKLYGPATATFRDLNCHAKVDIEMIGVWDTVKALGLPYPLLTYLAPMATGFHNETVCAPVKNAFHALALDEDRTAFRPVMWETERCWSGRLEQVWFRGAHSDIGGQINKATDSRGLSNIPLVWILERTEECGIPLPKGWRARFPCNVNAQAVGSRQGIAKLFLLRCKRTVGDKPGEFIHESVRMQSGTDKISAHVQQTP